jgi:WD40 repeat protein
LCQLLATSGHLPLVIFVPVRNAVLLLRPVLVTTTPRIVWDVSEEGYPLLIDPVTGDPRLGGSSSGREAARVVKFSPEGSSRDLMVFSEENSNIHIIDARTFHTHVILPVPADQAASTSAIPAGGQSSRSGVEGGTWGIAGVAFDPSGDWLYSGTERTVVEWDMRRCGGGGEAGTWQMA